MRLLIIKRKKKMEPDVLITFDAAKSIINNSTQFDIETGGLLVGTLGKPMTIIAAGSPGKNGAHHATSFTSDPQADRQTLLTGRENFGPKIILTGYWHKHPYGLTTPSSADCQQVRQLAREYGDDKPILMGIVNQSRGKIFKKTTLHLYSVNALAKLVEHTWKLVSRKNKYLLEVIEKAPTTIEVRNTEFWADRDFQSYLNPIGRERIKEEIAMLKQFGWEVEMVRRKEDKILILNATKEFMSINFTLPAEFPLNPPIVKTRGGRRFAGLESLLQWNTLCRLADIAIEAAKVMECPYCSRRLIVNTADSLLKTTCY
jgi:proteasome lid subunit RPN8/RPN11